VSAKSNRVITGQNRISCGGRGGRGAAVERGTGPTLDSNRLDHAAGLSAQNLAWQQARQHRLSGGQLISTGGSISSREEGKSLRPSSPIVIDATRRSEFSRGTPGP